MNIPEEFGKYLLLKKLREDPLGETFRAGRAGKDGIEQVVLLRVLNGQGLDGEKLWNRVSGRGPVQQALRSPNIGSGVDLGKVRSYPYVAYDYVSGKDLASLFAQAARLHSSIPADHALLIAERIALALAAAYETRVQEERVLHGFVVPQLVMISNEGESRLLGFEIAPGLRELSASGFGNPDLRPYLSPESATAPLGRADDVYSLGAILYELLTSQRLPPPPAEGYGALIDAAELPNEGTPLPPAIAALLKKSLVPREQRIPDAVTWHKTISKLMIDGHFTSTTFNLAFFMHNLFRDEIERESQEIQAEKTLELPRRQVAAAAPQPAPAAAPQALRDSTGVRDVTLSGSAVPAQPAAGGSKKGLWIGIAAALVAALAAGGYFAFGRSPAKPVATTANLPAAPALPAPTGQPAVTAAPAGPSPEQLKAQIDQMVAASGKEMETKLKQQYDDRIKQLQQQLEESKKAPDARRAERSAPPPTPVEAAPPPVETRPTTHAEPAAPPPSAPPPAASTGSPASAAPGTTTTAAVPSPAAAAPPPASAPAPVPAPARQPQVQYGDLVQLGAGVSLPKMTAQAEPRYPAMARRFNKAAQVSLKVLVDERGHVIEAERIGEKAGFGFDEAAIEAARRAVFQPATKDGVRVKIWTSMRVSFKP